MKRPRYYIHWCDAVAEGALLFTSGKKPETFAWCVKDRAKSTEDGETHHIIAVATCRYNALRIVKAMNATSRAVAPLPGTHEELIDG